MEVIFKTCKGEFMLLPNFNFDKWFNFKTHKFQKVITIGWLFWFVRFIRDDKQHSYEL
jgi:hypothetical protein